MLEIISITVLTAGIAVLAMRIFFSAPRNNNNRPPRIKGQIRVTLTEKPGTNGQGTRRQNKKIFRKGKTRKAKPAPPAPANGSRKL